MADAWRWGNRDESSRSPLQGGEAQEDHGGTEHRKDRYLRVGVSHPSGDPTRHRVFEVRASYREADSGWVAQVGELNLNDQLEGWSQDATDGRRSRAFATPAACLGDAVAALVTMVDREAPDRP